MLTFNWLQPSTLSSNISDKVSCTVWEGMDVKKADLSVLDVAAAIIAKVDVIPESTDYLFGGENNSAIFYFQKKSRMTIFFSNFLHQA